MLTYNYFLYCGGKASMLAVMCLLEQIQRSWCFIFVLVSLKKHIIEQSIHVLIIINDVLHLDIYGAQYDADHLLVHIIYSFAQSTMCTRARINS